MNGRQPPPYFSSVRDRSRQRWDQLESDPELAGPWKQLFGQVQSPRHVLSELLQNADDVGARTVRASVRDGRFTFEHDGKDFDEDEFASLCRFGFSNKRKLHTIGFRGVGFKSTFSLGEPVEVLTPSLAVQFHKRRFTEPVWIHDAPPCDVTRIAVKVQDPNRERELRKNLQEWGESPASLLLFNNINELTIDDVTLRKQPIGPGPVPSSERIRLVGHGEHDVLLFASPEEPFPDEAVGEIRQERDVEELHLPPCRVELLVDLPGAQRLYVVLPTGVIVKTPFSCNAPFLQDPARSVIKAPSLSPTNRWLLHRLGRLAGSAMLAWLQNQSLEPDVRAKAYCLLPDKPCDGDSLEADVTQAICQGFAEAVGDRPILLATTGQLVHSNDCIAPPRQTYHVWTPAQLLEVFGDGDEHVLSEAVSEEQRRRLKSWGWLERPSDSNVINRLAEGRRVPRPGDNRNLLVLWGMVQESVRYDYGGQQRSRLAIVPVEGADVLFPANEVVRLPEKKETICNEAWQFLRGLVRVVDPDWLRFLDDGLKTEAPQLARAALQLLSDVGLARASQTEVIAQNACRSLFSRQKISLEDHVRIAHLMAALDAKTPAEFRCVTRDGRQRRPDEGIIATQDPAVEALLPEDWAAAHLLHDDYFKGYSACTRQQWEEWVRSDKSSFCPFPPIRVNREGVRGMRRLADTLRSREAPPPTFFPYVTDNFYLSDHDFDAELFAFWTEMAKTDRCIWTKVVRRIFQAPPRYWQSQSDATVFQIATTGNKKRVFTESPIPARWIVRFRGLACLPDTYGHVRIPAELYLRTPETEPLLGVEPFVSPELDTEATKPLLRLLGVRETPAGLGKLLERIRALARAPDPVPLMGEILKWYDALDRALVRCDAAGIEEPRQAFINEPLVLTAENQWAKASEVFLHASDEYPDAPLVHPAANNLGMWARVGVADRPSADLVLGWLKNLPSGQPLDSGVIRRVCAALQRYPIPVWQACGHWLALDNSWVPVERLRFRLTMHSLTRRALFPAIKAATANFQMLSVEACDRHPFSGLPDLGTRIEYRLTHGPDPLGVAAQKPWLVALANGLARVKLEDEAQTQHLRRAAMRLAHSIWQPFDEQDSLQVTPYVDGTPAGQPHSPDVLWHEQSIFIRSGSLARSFDALVDELARPFNHDRVTEAIKACVERAPDFIAEYMEKHFALEAEPSPTPDISAAAAEVDKDEAQGRVGEEGEPGADVAEAVLDGESPESTDTDEEHDHAEESDRQPRHKREPSLFQRFALSRGYRWDSVRKRFVHSDGSWMERCESPFQWQRFDSRGNIVTRYWASPQRLARGGAEIPAELWDLFRKSPSECCMVLVDGADNPLELRGTDLIQGIENKQIGVYPAKYRIREESRT